MRSYADTHCDTIVKLYHDGQHLRSNRGQMDLQRLRQFGSNIQVFALWMEPWYYSKAFVQAMTYFDFFQSELAQNTDWIGQVYTYDDILQNKKQGKLSAILSMEGGEALESSIDNLHLFYQKGVRMLSLTWNHSNTLADGVGAKSKGGLTKIGRTMVQEMQRLGMILDVSHLSDAGFYDVAELMQMPWIASHSNARAICGHPRNLTDNQLRILGEGGGYVGLNFYPPFVAEKKSVSTEDLVVQISYLLEKAGEDAVGFGSDFDGIAQTPVDLCAVEDMQRFLEKLEREFGASLLQKICEDNFLRVAKTVWKGAETNI